MVLFLVFMVSALAAALLPAPVFAGSVTDLSLYAGNAHYMAALGFILIILEFLLPTKGLLGLMGLAMFVPGTFMLADNANPDLRLSWPVVIGLNVIVIAMFIVTIVITIRGYTRQNMESIDTLVNSRATVIEWDGHAGRVSLQGTTWNATCITHLPLDEGDTVIVTGHHNLTLTVTKEKI